MDLGSSFRALVREIVGLPTTEGQPPQIDRLAHYRARVDAAAADGSTLDVTPEDTRISAEKNVPLRVGIPGSYAVVASGAIVWLGWDGGNPKKPHCVPTWESASVTKLVLKATMVYLGDESGAEALVKKSEFNGHTHKYNPGPSAATDTLVPTVLAVGTANVQAK